MRASRDDFWESKLDARPTRGGRFEAVARRWRDLNPSRRAPGGPFACWIDDLRNQQGEPVTSANHAIQVLRNARAHRQGTRLGASDAAATLARYLPLVEAMVGHVFNDIDVTLYRRVRVEEGGVRGFALRGAHPDRRFEESEIPVADAVFTQCGTEVVAVCDGVAEPLSPLVGPEPDAPDGRPPTDGMREELLVVEPVQRDRVVLLCVVRPVWSRAWFPAMLATEVERDGDGSERRRSRGPRLGSGDRSVMRRRTSDLDIPESLGAARPASCCAHGPTTPCVRDTGG